MRDQRSLQQRFLLANGYAVRLRIDIDDIHPMPQGNTQALALADGEVLMPVVRADGIAGRIDQLARANVSGDRRFTRPA